MDIIQGDVVLKEIEKITGKKISEGKYILAYGEATGHHHEISGDIKIFKSESQVQVLVDSEATLTHPEHGTIVVPESAYEVKIQREVDLIGEVRRVLD